MATGCLREKVVTHELLGQWLPYYPEIVSVLICSLTELHDCNLYKTLEFGLIQESKLSKKSVPTLPELSPSVAMGRLRKKLSPTNRSGNGCLTWLVTSQGTLRNVWRGPLLPPYCRAAHYDGGQSKYIQKVS